MRYLVLAICLTILNSSGLAQTVTGKADLDDERKAALNKAYIDEAKTYEISIHADPTVQPKFNPKPVFSWLNAARVGTPRVQHGGVFVWEDQGRAEILGTIFSQTIGTRTPTMYYELHSLATHGLTGNRSSGLFWNTEQPGITPKLVPKTPAPAKSRGLRMAQMRRISRRFSGYSINYDDKRWSLNLLQTPLHRTADGHPTVLDGALFTLISTAGTDPEVLVLIEARKAGEDWKWHYSLCRFTDLRTFVSLDKKEVQSYPGSGEPYPNKQTDPYHYRPLGEVKFSSK